MPETACSNVNPNHNTNPNLNSNPNPNPTTYPNNPNPKFNPTLQPAEGTGEIWNGTECRNGTDLLRSGFHLKWMKPGMERFVSYFSPF